MCYLSNRPAAKSSGPVAQLVKKVRLDFFDCAFPPNIFVFAKNIII